jgi:hypothetical protein
VQFFCSQQTDIPVLLINRVVVNVLKRSIISDSTDVGSGGHLQRPFYAVLRSVSENPVVGPRASGFSTGKDGEAGDIGVYRRYSRTQSSRKTSRSKPDQILRQAPGNSVAFEGLMGLQ